jgi:hypothetical protein
MTPSCQLKNTPPPGKIIWVVVVDVDVDVDVVASVDVDALRHFSSYVFVCRRSPFEVLRALRRRGWFISRRARRPTFLLCGDAFNVHR